MTILTYYVALPFVYANDGSTVPGEAVECPNAEIAILQAAVLSQVTGHVGAIAFSRTGDPDVGKFEDAIVLRTFGELTVDPTMLC
jgi:hypothetical protein